MSKEEKKHRVMCIFEAELAQASRAQQRAVQTPGRGLKEAIVVDSNVADDDKSKPVVVALPKDYLLEAAQALGKQDFLFKCRSVTPISVAACSFFVIVLAVLAVWFATREGGPGNISPNTSEGMSGGGEGMSDSYLSPVLVARNRISSGDTARAGAAAASIGAKTSSTRTRQNGSPSVHQAVVRSSFPGDDLGLGHTLSIIGSRSTAAAVPQNSANGGAHFHSTADLRLFGDEGGFPATNDAEKMMATVQMMWVTGLEKLKVSQFEEAEHLFAGALDLLEISIEETQGDELQDLESVKAEIVADEGFALVGVRRYEESVRVIQVFLQACDPSSRPSHLVNALGYALFQLGDFAGAGEIFQLGASEVPSNRVLWSNLAAAKMLQGDLETADGALHRALEPEGLVEVSNDQKTVILFNARQLTLRTDGIDSEGEPIVELFYNSNWRWGE